MGGAIKHISMHMQLLFTITESGKIAETEQLRKAFKLAPGRYLLEITPHNVRSLDQNDYYHAVVVPAVRKGLYAEGYDEIKTNADAHAFLKKQFLNKDNALIFSNEESTRALSTKEFSAFIDTVIKWAAEFLKVQIPYPNEKPVLIAEYDNELKATIINNG